MECIKCGSVFENPVPEVTKTGVWFSTTKGPVKLVWGAFYDEDPTELRKKLGGKPVPICRYCVIHAMIDGIAVG